jgi:hypothetical protein
VHLSDDRPAPAEIVLSAQAAPDGLAMTLTVRPSAGEPGFATAPTYRPLTWDDVQALARADGVHLRRDEAGVHITLPWMAA